MTGQETHLDTDWEYEMNSSFELFKTKLREAQGACFDLKVEIPFFWRDLRFSVLPEDKKFTEEDIEAHLIDALDKVNDLTESEKRVIFFVKYKVKYLFNFDKFKRHF